jgi:hypothetical protein
MKNYRITQVKTSLWAAALVSGIFFTNAVFAEGGKRSHGVPDAFKELIENSLKEKVGLTFFMNGQSLPAVVTKVIDERTIEGRNQQYDRIIIRLGRVNAIARN